MKKGIIGGLIALMLIASISVSAFGNWGTRENAKAAIEAGDYEAWIEATGRTEQHFENIVAIHNARQSGDYEAWKQAMQNLRPDVEVMSEDDFNLLMQIREARQSGDYENARELREGMPGKFEGGFGMRGRFSSDWRNCQR